MKLRSMNTAALMALCIVGLSSCATKGDIESLRQEINSLQQTTAQALENSNEAKRIAASSLSETEIARQDAAAARASAEDANSKLDRVFERSMQK